MPSDLGSKDLHPLTAVEMAVGSHVALVHVGVRTVREHHGFAGSRQVGSDGESLATGCCSGPKHTGSAATVAVLARLASPGDECLQKCGVEVDW